MPVENRKPVKELLAKAAMVFGIASTDKKIGVPFEVDDDGQLRVVSSVAPALTTTINNIYTALASIAALIVGTALTVVRGKGGILTSGILTSDTSVKASAGDVYWITICADDVLAVEINDSIADGGTDHWGQFYPADNYSHYIFDPPIECSTGIYIDITTNGNPQVVVGYK